MLDAPTQYERIKAIFNRSPAFLRLSRVTFLGILSPKFRDIKRFPAKLLNPHSRLCLDGSRMDHSLGVAEIAFYLSRRLTLSDITQRYAVAWGLLHDIATWPLSHTGEAALSEVTKTSHRALREMMIFGSDVIQSRFSTLPLIKEAGLDADTLLSLFKKEATGFSNDTEVLHQIIHSPLTPDTLEGIWRSGLAYGYDVPEPKKVSDCLHRDLFGASVNKDSAGSIFSFWKAKSKIYDTKINTEQATSFESQWSSSIRTIFRHLTLKETLDLTESEVIEAVLRRGAVCEVDTFKYKPPLRYLIPPDRGKSDIVSLPIGELDKILIKERLER